MKTDTGHDAQLDAIPGVRRRGDPDRTADDAVRVLYIVGIGRSGSTLLCRTLGSVEGFVATGELMRIMDRGLKNGDLCSCGTAVGECGLWHEVLEDLTHRCPDLDFDQLERTRKRITEGWEFLRYLFLPEKISGFEQDLPEYRRFLGQLYRSIRAVTGARTIVDASKNLLYARMLTETPGVKVTFLHLIRDSRGVAHSLAKKQERPGTSGRYEHFRQLGPVLGSILWDTAQITSNVFGRRAERVLRVRYEDFVSAPSRTVNTLLEDLGLPRSPDLAPHVDGTSVCLGVDHLIASNPNRSRRGVIELREDVTWRQEMPSLRRWVVTAMTLPLLRKYGYQVMPGRNGGARGMSVMTRSMDPEG